MSSLVICGNELQDGSGTSTFQAPFSFNNHLQQPLRVPPNSEVAVQSLKIVKEGVLSVTPASKWFQYYGVKLSDTIPITETTSAPITTDLGIDRNQGLSAEGIAEKIQVGLNKGVPNPETFGLCSCDVQRDGEGAFEGFRHEFKERGSNASGSNTISQTWVNNYEGEGGMSYNSSNNRLTALSSADAGVYNVAIGTDNPIALNEGEFIIDVSETAGTSWCVGLTRSRAVGLDADYFDPNDSFITRNANIFGDFIVGAFQTETNQRQLRVLHAVYDTTSAIYDADTPMTMREVSYYTGDGDLDEVYNWSTNFSSGRGFTKVRFTIENENIKVDLFEPNADPSKSAYIELVTASGDKGTRFKPVADTCRALYPIVFQSKSSSSGSDRYLTIESYKGRNVGMKYGTTDWWGYLSANDLERQYGLEVDTRPYNDMGTATEHTYKGLAGGFLKDYDVVMIVEKDDTDKYPETGDANSSILLGFEGKSVVDTYSNTNASGLGYFDSNSVPELKSTSALFVRLNNLNIRTYNANKSAFSKIVYSVPKFSTGTDKNIGSLFFEAPEKTYVALNNPDELILNTFNIDLVNEDETLATDLTGKSVCILHIRQTPSM